MSEHRCPDCGIHREIWMGARTPACPRCGSQLTPRPVTVGIGVEPQGMAAPDVQVFDDLPRRRRKRTGRDTLADLADAPENLRLLADWHEQVHPRLVAAAGDPDWQVTGTEVQDDLRRWATAIDEILDFEQSRVWKVLGGVFLAGLAVGLGIAGVLL